MFIAYIAFSYVVFFLVLQSLDCLLTTSTFEPSSKDLVNGCDSGEKLVMLSLF